MSEQKQAATEITKAVDDTRKQSNQLARAIVEQARTIKEMTTASQNISKQIGLINRANREHSKTAASTLERLHSVRNVTAQNSEGARKTLRGTRTLMDTVEALVADMDDLGENGNGIQSRRKRSSQKLRQSKNGGSI